MKGLGTHRLSGQPGPVSHSQVQAFLTSHEVSLPPTAQSDPRATVQKHHLGYLHDKGLQGPIYDTQDPSLLNSFNKSSLCILVERAQR